MLLLLPPSEGKTAPRPGGLPLDLDRLGSPALNPVRRAVLDALVQVSAWPDAARTLGVGPSLADEVRRNTTLHGAPTAPAREVYTGVLYAAAGLTQLERTGRRRAEDCVRTVSALWGLVAPSDLIPAYRLSMGTDLPGIGPLAAAWRAPLAAELADRAAAEVVVDCRSAAYLAAWRPPTGADWVTVRVERDHDGARTVVSHHAKHTRGVLARHMLTRPGRLPRDAETLAACARELVGTVHEGVTAGATTTVAAVELAPPGRGARALTIVLR